MKILIFTLIGLLLLGCEPSETTTNNSEEIAKGNTYIYNSNLSKWIDSGITSYSFNYEYSGIFEIAGKWEVQVYNEDVIYVNYIGDGYPAEIESLDIESAPTIITLYDDILACDEGDGCDISKADFDDDYFFPSYIYRSTTKDGSSFTITEFVQQ